MLTAEKGICCCCCYPWPFGLYNRLLQIPTINLTPQPQILMQPFANSSPSGGNSRYLLSVDILFFKRFFTLVFVFLLLLWGSQYLIYYICFNVYSIYICFLYHLSHCLLDFYNSTYLYIIRM